MEPDSRYAGVALGRFSELLASDSPVPGGGSAAAVVAALAASLLCMVARLTRGRDRYADFEAIAAEVEEAADRLRESLLDLADRDARAYEGFLAARRLPRASDAERRERDRAVERATVESIQIPLRVAQDAAAVAALAARLAGSSNPHAASDVGSAAAFASAALRAAVLSVRINLPALPVDHPTRVEASGEIDRLLSSGAQSERTADERVRAVLA